MSIHLADVRHRYKSVLALDRVSLTVRRGDLYGFIGHNGAGKTTALRVALGLLRPDSGRVWIDGHDATRNPRVRALVGGLIEAPGFHEGRSGPRNLYMLAALQGIPPAARGAEIARVLELVGLTGSAGKRVGHYSQGMRQRLGLAQAILGGPLYLLLDEPTNGLDPQGIQELRVLLQKLARESDATILLSSHLLAEVSGLCNRVGVLHSGELLVEAETSELLRHSIHTYRLHTDDDAEASALVRSATPGDTEVVGAGAGGLTITLPDGADFDPPAIVQQLVAAGRRVFAFAPVEPSLEQIYLEYARGDRARAAPAAAADRGADEPPPLPGGSATAIARVMGYEARRLARPGPMSALLVPALLAPLVVYRRLLGAADSGAEVASGQTVSTTAATAFDALGRALLPTVPLLALIFAGMASQSLAGELRGGTLRNLLLRPFHRFEIVVGKLWVLLTLAITSYLLLLGSAALAAGLAFDYGDLVEKLATGATFPLLSAEEVWPELWPAVASPLLPLLGFTAFGFLCGTIARSAAGALILAFGSITAMELGRGFARGWHLESLLLGPHIPSPLPGHDSHLDYFVQVAGGVSREPWELSIAVPLCWLLACWLLAAATFQRKYVS